MERLTVNDLNKVCYDPWELCGMDNYCKKGCHEELGCTKGCHILKMYRKLAEYEDLEEQGRLLKLPCAVWDKYYRIDDGTYPNEWEFVNVQQIISVMDKIGKTVFLTKSSAEQALKEMEGKK